MPINKQLRCNCKVISKYILFPIMVFIVLTYTIYLFIPFAPRQFLVHLSSEHSNLSFTRDTVYFLNGVAYDFYSINEQHSQSGPSRQWKTFPLPHEHLSSHVQPWTPHQMPAILAPSSPPTSTGLAFVERIYITTAFDLKDRQANIEQMLVQNGITNYEWRMKWTRKTCNTPQYKNEVHQKINLRSGFISGEKRKRQCAITMEHIDIWHDIVKRNLSLALIFEDDAVFVPFFREKLDRTIYTAIRIGALKIDGLSRCATGKTHTHEWVEQDPMIVIGGCMQLYGKAFRRDDKQAPPLLSTQKESGSRCSHAYLLTACSARALVRQISIRKNNFAQSDLLLNVMVARSPTLQSFWLDPPIVYQGNQINDLDGIPSFKRTSY